MRITRKLGLKYLFLRIYGGALGICLTIGIQEKNMEKDGKSFHISLKKKVFFYSWLGMKI